jgi:hypothetical protein
MQKGGREYTPHVGRYRPHHGRQVNGERQEIDSGGRHEAVLTDGWCVAGGERHCLYNLHILPRSTDTTYITGRPRADVSAGPYHARGTLYDRPW